jgi:2-octaprenyl-6-methoxyphenol hydroxylase
MALLPREEGYALVWTVAATQAEELLALDDDAFIATFQANFGERAGMLSQPSARGAFALTLRKSDPAPSGRIVRIGNAAQTLHPVAAQGFNLGLRDVWQLATLINADPIGIENDAIAAQYRRTRALDRTLSIGMTDLLVQGFSGDLPGLTHARGLALQAMDLLPPVRRLFTRRMLFGVSR